MVPGWMQIALVVVLILLFFGRGRVSDFMGDLAKGITSFKKGLKDGANEQTAIAKSDAPQESVAPKQAEKKDA